MTAPVESQALALVLVDELARCGVRHACLAPGSRSAPLAIAMAGDKRIAVHVVVDERSASFLALGIAKSSGSAAAVLSTSGTAAANFHPAVVEAHHARTPLIVLTADRPPELQATGANQTIDQTRLYGDSVRFFAEVGAAGSLAESVPYWRSVAARAHALASGPRAGPVHVNVPFREPLVPEPGTPARSARASGLDGRPEGEPWHRITTGRRVVAGDVADHVSRLLEASTRPLLVAGSGHYATDGLLELAEHGDIPILAEAASGLRRGPTAISTYDALLRIEQWADAHQPDLVLRVGKTATSKSLARLLAGGVEQILIDPDLAFEDPERAATTVVAAHPEEIAAALNPSGLKRAQSGWLEEWLQAEGLARDAVDSVLDAADEPTEPRTARDLASMLPDGATLVVASSMPVRDLDWFMAPRAGVRVLANRGASGIDGFVSTALGVAIAGPAPTVALTGDLSMLHDSNGFTLAGAGHVDVVFVVVNNDGGGIFSFLPQAEWPQEFETLFGTPHGLDFEVYAELYRIGYTRLQRADDLEGVVVSATAAGGPHLIEIRTDRRANVDVHRNVWAAVEHGISQSPPARTARP
ncbi:MAG: 2-succinyl-5-enolpyruvyl-6-hydroxy-3-cyclohexene-1-carboxylic-acid synthase [Actinomycetota bacterium]